MADLPAAFFLHTFIGIEDLKRAVRFFRPLTLCQPWLMEVPDGARHFVETGLIQVQYPPADLKPGGNFKALLSEYGQWIRSTYDLGHDGFWKALREIGSPEESTWSIRGEIRSGRQNITAGRGNETVKWHLMLHLARSLEANRLETDQMLLRLIRKRPPLEDALGEDEAVHGLLDDLPLSPTRLPMDESLLNEVFEAWAALFGTYLTGIRYLLTIERHIMNYVKGLIAEVTSEVSKPAVPPELRLTLPGLSPMSLEELARLEPLLSQGTTGDHFRRLTEKFACQGRRQSDQISGLCKKIESSLPRERDGSEVRLSMIYLPRSSEEGISSKSRLPATLSGKMLILLEGGSHG